MFINCLHGNVHKLPIQMIKRYLLAENGEWRENVKDKHRTDAKNGWYRYETQFAVPVLDAKKAVDHYTVYGGTLLIRNDADGKSYLYDLIDVEKKKVISKTPFSAQTHSDVTSPKPSQAQYTREKAGSQGKSSGGEKFSMRDSAGRELTAAQQDYFKDSKVRDAEGNLLVMYHQTDGAFTVFDTRHKGAGTGDDETPFGIFMKTTARNIGVRGETQMELYANIRNPLRVRDRAELVAQLREMSGDYAKLKDQSEKVDKEYGAKFAEAKDAFKNFLLQWRKENPDAPSRAAYDAEGFNAAFDAEDNVVKEWTQKKDELALRAKEAITDALRENGYDGVILKNDRGSFGRNTDAYIALDANQVKNVTNQNPTTSEDIRYSVRESAGRIVEGGNGAPYWNDLSYRGYTEDKAIPDSIGYAMFADDPHAIENYGSRFAAVRHDDLPTIDDFKESIAKAWERDKAKYLLPPELEVFSDRSGAEMADHFDPVDIVDGADAWDTPELITWAFSHGIFDEVGGVKTADGAIAWDDSLIRGTSDDGGVWGSNLHDEKYSVRDSAYMDAVKRGDTAAAQKMVDEAAEEALKSSKVRLDADGDYWYGEGELAPVYHSTDNEFYVFDKRKLGENTDNNAADEYLASTAHVGFWFNTQDLSQNERSGYAGGRGVKCYLDCKRVFEAGTIDGLANSIAEYWDEDLTPAENGEAFANVLRGQGYDGVVLNDEEFGGISFVALEPEQIKSADPVTYDRDGNIIPLSKRFDSTNADIRYSVRDYGLTEEEEHAIVSYKSGDSYTLNGKLSTGGELTSQQRRLRDHLDAALEKLPVYRGTVYRHYDFDAFGGFDAMADFLSQFSKGNPKRMDAYLSASTVPNENRTGGEYTVDMVIRSETGRSLNGFGLNTENEVLLPRGTRLVVDSMELVSPHKIRMTAREAINNESGTTADAGTSGMRQLREGTQGRNDLRPVSGQNSEEVLGQGHRDPGRDGDTGLSGLREGTRPGSLDESGVEGNRGEDSEGRVKLQPRERSVSDRQILANALESVAQNERERDILADYREKAKKLAFYERELAKREQKIAEHRSGQTLLEPDALTPVVCGSLRPPALYAQGKSVESPAEGDRKFGRDDELLANGKILIDKTQNARYHATNKNSMFMERSGGYVLQRFSNDDLHVYGHGYADAHGFVRSIAAFPEHPGSNVSLLNELFTHLKRGAFELPAFFSLKERHDHDSLDTEDFRKRRKRQAAGFRLAHGHASPDRNRYKDGYGVGTNVRLCRNHIKRFSFRSAVTRCIRRLPDRPPIASPQTHDRIYQTI